MDVYVDTNAVCDGADGVTQMIGGLGDLTEFIIGRLNAAGRDFTSVNFFRTADDISTASNAMRSMCEKLEAAKRYLAAVVECIDEYSRTVY